uniref:Uncharacterized protein n=1 Tax=Ditylenchus dipsaci TaxID=166011 RepID=A0A915D501_9BILA
MEKLKLLFVVLVFSKSCKRDTAIYSSPHLSQSDVQAESFVDTFKRAIDKIKTEWIGQNAIDKLTVCLQKRSVF